MTIPAPASPGLPERLGADTLAALQVALANSKARTTRRAYGTAWAAWSVFADAHGLEELPAEPAAVAAYLAHRHKEGVGIATLRMAATAIAAAHAHVGEPNPCAHLVVREALRGLAKESRDRPPRQAAGLTAEAVAAIRATIGQSSKRKVVRDMALIAVLADAGLRRSEAVALRWGDVQTEPDGSGRVTIRWSKSDQEGEGAVVALTIQAMADLARWAALTDSSPSTQVFALSGSQVSRIVARRAGDAGLGDGFSGHSGRVGMAQRMTRNGAPAAAVMRQGRWSTSRMVARYTREIAAGEALRYL